jgi:molybdopterin synthase sulfur carrier subunit
VIRVELPAPLQVLAGVPRRVTLADGVPATQRGVLDALEARYPALRGTIRDPVTGRRRPFLRFYAELQDHSDDPPDDPLPPAVAEGREAFIVLGAIAGG